MTAAAKPPPDTDSAGAKDRPWELRLWNGINIGGWYRLLVRNRFAVTPRRWGMALIITVICVVNSLLWLLQTLIYGRRIARTEIREAPLFIIGHWRTGTTLLHELIILDPRHTYPDTFACFAPNHFVLSGPLLKWWLKFLLPSRRPMDNMRVGWDRPQEDEFALCSMGLPSPYLWWAFANRPRQCQEYLELRDVPPDDLVRWKRAFLWFLKCITLKDPKRIVLKSPTHTCRVRTLLELFPDARFVHIVRDPLVVFPSTMKLWKRMTRYHGLQVPRNEGLEEYVFETFRRVYGALFEDMDRIDPARFCQVRYEDLLADPVGQMRQVYEALDLGEFDQVAPAIADYFAEQADYKTNRFELPPELRDEIQRRWGDVIQRLGYCHEPRQA